MSTREILISKDWMLVSASRETLRLLSLPTPGPVEIAVTVHDENRPDCRGHRLNLDERLTGDQIGHGATWARLEPDSPMNSATIVITPGAPDNE